MTEADKIRLGIIGLGAMGLEMLRVANQHSDYVVTVASDIDTDAIDFIKEEFPAINFSSSPIDVIESDKVDAVYIASPPNSHAKYAILSMQLGKAVFCEKPLTVNLPEGIEMVEAARETQMINAVNFALADRHAVFEIERAVKSGEVGNIEGVEIRLLFPKWPRSFQSKAYWLNSRTQGGFIREVFSHFAYLTDRIVGPLVPRFLQLDFSNKDSVSSEVSAHGLFYAGNVPVKVSGQSQTAAPETYEWNLYGSKLSYSLRNWDELYSSDGTEWKRVFLSCIRGTEHTRLTEFAKAIRGEKNCLPDFLTSLIVAQLVESFHR